MNIFIGLLLSSVALTSSYASERPSNKRAHITKNHTHAKRAIHNKSDSNDNNDKSSTDKSPLSDDEIKLIDPIASEIDGSLSFSEEYFTNTMRIAYVKRCIEKGHRVDYGRYFTKKQADKINDILRERNLRRIKHKDVSNDKNQNKPTNISPNINAKNNQPMYPQYSNNQMNQNMIQNDQNVPPQQMYNPNYQQGMQQPFYNPMNQNMMMQPQQQIPQPAPAAVTPTQPAPAVVAPPPPPPPAVSPPPPPARVIHHRH